MTPFAVTLNHYVLAAACLMVAVNGITRRGLATRGAALGAGFWVAASLACDVPPAFLFAAGLGVAALIWAPKKIGWIALGAAPLLLGYAALNQRIIGSPFPPNMHEEKMLYYPGSYFGALKAAAEAGHPGYYQASYLRRLFHATLGHKGIFWMMPLLALATAGAIALARRRAPGWGLALAWAAFPLVAIALTMRWAWDLSGGAYNIRHILAAIPPLYCVLARGTGVSPVIRRLFWPAAVWGCLIAWIGVMNPWSHNTLSAYPPLENIARAALAHPDKFDTAWIGDLIQTTSVTPDVGWLDLGETRLGQAQAWAAEGQTAEARAALREAEHALKEAIRVKPQESLPYYHLGIAQDMQGRPLDAIETYQKLLKLDPKNLGGWNNLGIFALKARNLELAREAYKKSEELAPGNPTAAWGMLLAGDLEGKRDPEAMRKALKKFPEDGRIQSLAKAWGMN